MRSNTRTKAALAAAGLYAASMLLPAYNSPILGSSATYPGYDAFRVGWVCAIRFDLPGWELWRVMLSLAWVANPCIWSATFCLTAGFYRLAMFYAGFALGLQVITAFYF